MLRLYIFHAYSSYIGSANYENSLEKNESDFRNGLEERKRVEESNWKEGFYVQRLFERLQLMCVDHTWGRALICAPRNLSRFRIWLANLLTYARLCLCGEHYN